jgi:hypothetical protein
MLPVSGSLITTYSHCYMNNGAAERSFYRGGDFNSSGAYGFASFVGNRVRSHAHTSIGFRSAFCHLPT